MSGAGPAVSRRSAVLPAAPVLPTVYCGEWRARALRAAAAHISQSETSLTTKNGTYYLGITITHSHLQQPVAAPHRLVQYIETGIHL